MDLEWGRAHAVALIYRAARWLAGEARRESWHTMLAPQLGGLAILTEHVPGIAVARRILANAPDEAFSASAITNVDRSRFVRREMPSEAEIARRFPPYGPAVLDYVRGFADPHIRLVLDGDPDAAWASAETNLAKEEWIETCAVLGDFDRAVALLPELDRGRQKGPEIVLCVESYRRGDHGLSTRMLDQLLADRPRDCWTLFQLAAGYLGRVPWGGYPFPDY